ncbi:MAG: MucR family transcriptional regulator [Rhodobacteraceae bacterium]|nr:MAG: MucR family transcriptional regulator [Paracoccaceae bacterium]
MTGTDQANAVLQSEELDTKGGETLVSLTARIVSSHLASAEMRREEVPDFMDEIYSKLSELSDRGGPRPRQSPAIPIGESITPDFIFCLEDGKKFRMLKKHLRSCYNMSPEQYRAKWGLAPEYPMVAPNYAVKRQELAKQSGLGKKRA